MTITQITAVVTSFCGGNRIIPTLESCKLQDYPYKDLVVSDDASDDGKTVAIIENWLKNNAQHFTNVTFIKNTQNLGFVENLRKAAIKAQGDIIINLGEGDTYYSTETFTRVANEIEKQRNLGLNDPLVWLGYNKSYKLSPQWTQVNDHLLAYPFSMTLLKNSPAKALTKLLEGNFISAQSFVYNKEYFQDGIYPIPNTIKSVEDYPMTCWMLVTKKKFGHLPIFVRWYEKGTGISATRNIKHLADLKKVHDFIEEITHPYSELNKIAKESKKMNQLRSISNRFEREVKKAFFRLSRVLLHPIRTVNSRIFSFKKKRFIKVNSGDIIKQIDIQSGKSFAKEFLM